METDSQKNEAILDLAWKRAANFSTHSGRRKDGFFYARRLITILSIVVTLIAIMTQLYKDWLEENPGLRLAAQIVFVATPVVASTLAAFASKKYANGDWWVTRAATEEIKKEIYYYRTIWPKDKRNEMLEKSLERIQRQVYRALGGVFALEEAREKKSRRNKQAASPAEYIPKPDGDDGYNDLTGDEYFEHRVKEQLDWHNNKINKLKKERDRMTVFILAVGALGTVLATLGSTQPERSWGIWVALTASIASALIGWEQLRGNEAIIRNYSKVVLELSILRDHWLNMTPEKKATPLAFEKLVKRCEGVLWAQNTEYIKTMQDVLKDNDLEEEAKLANTAREDMVVTYESTKTAMQESTIQVLKETVSDSGEMVEESYQATLDTLKEEGTELLQKQLDAAGETISEAADNFVERVPTLKSYLAQIAEDYSEVEVGRDTSKEQLNEILSRYPKTGELKG